MDNTDANDTRKFSLCLSQSGGRVQLSEQVAVAQQILTDRSSSNGSEKTLTPTIEVPADALVSLILMAVCQRGEMMSPDARWLALHRVKDEARKMGISESVVSEVAGAVESYGKPIEKANPISGMF